eukprot:1153032-Pelagomonas_calceolata.AAC.1
MCAVFLRARHRVSPVLPCPGFLCTTGVCQARTEQGARDRATSKAVYINVSCGPAVVGSPHFQLVPSVKRASAAVGSYKV